MTDVEVEVETWGEGGVAYVAFDGSEEGVVGIAEGDAVDIFGGSQVNLTINIVFEVALVTSGGGMEENIALLGEEILEVQLEADDVALHLNQAVYSGEFYLLLDDFLPSAKGVDICQWHLITENQAREDCGLDGEAGGGMDVDSPEN